MSLRAQDKDDASSKSTIDSDENGSTTVEILDDASSKSIIDSDENGSTTVQILDDASSKSIIDSDDNGSTTVQILDDASEKSVIGSDGKESTIGNCPSSKDIASAATLLDVNSEILEVTHTSVISIPHPPEVGKRVFTTDMSSSVELDHIDGMDMITADIMDEEVALVTADIMDEEVAVVTADIMDEEVAVVTADIMDEEVAVVTADIIDEKIGSIIDNDTQPQSLPALGKSGPSVSLTPNSDFLPDVSILCFFAVLVSLAQWLASTSPTLGFVFAVAVLALMSEWESRVRYSFGRVRERCHFAMPTPTSTQQDSEPPTPYIPPEQEKIRTDPSTILKHAQDTVGSSVDEGQSAMGGQSALEIALVNVLKAAIDAGKSDQDGGEKGEDEKVKNTEAIQEQPGLM